MNTPNEEPKPLGAEVESTTFKGVCNADEALARKVVATVLKLEEAAWKPVSHHIADYCDLIRTQRDYAETQCADMFEAIRALTVENATLKAERDESKAEITVITNCYCECGGTAKGEGGCTACQMYHEIEDTFSKRNGVPRTDVSSNRSQCDTPTCPTCLERDLLKARVVAAVGDFVAMSEFHDESEERNKVLETQLAAANSQNAEILTQRDMMAEMLNGKVFALSELKAAGLGMCTLEDQAHAVYRLKQENAELRARLERMRDMPEIDQDDAYRLRALAKAALAQAGGPLCVNCGIGFILPSGVCDHCDSKQAGGKEGV